MAEHERVEKKNVALPTGVGEVSGLRHLQARNKFPSKCYVFIWQCATNVAYVRKFFVWLQV